MNISINYLYTVLAICVTSALLYAGAEMSKFTTELIAFRRSFILDLDKARRTFLEETEYVYMLGCQQGVDYGQSHKPVVGFDANSPIMFCNSKLEHMQDYLTRKAIELGR